MQCGRKPGSIQKALDEAARLGFANGAFEELDEDGPAVVEFFPDQQGSPAKPNVAAPKGLSGRLRRGCHRQRRLAKRSASEDEGAHCGPFALVCAADQRITDKDIEMEPEASQGNPLYVKVSCGATAWQCR